ncbi:unnamed protein product [Trichogramma brassicae]|uniref:Peptidoglycan recognition protein family domain-containing protein n=1 Tax=Trichogramma brassicae TaxID=86971 RepID=A0A6H5IQX1_9HYME|nr:unnamed protein product [Trichogramma brassicae]
METVSLTDRRYFPKKFLVSPARRNLYRKNYYILLFYKSDISDLHPGGRAARSALELGCPGAGARLAPAPGQTARPGDNRAHGLAVVRDARPVLGLGAQHPAVPDGRERLQRRGLQLHAGRRLAAVRGPRLAGARRLQRLRVQLQEPRRRVPGQLRAGPAQAGAVAVAGGLPGAGHEEGTAEGGLQAAGPQAGQLDREPGQASVRGDQEVEALVAGALISCRRLVSRGEWQAEPPSRPPRPVESEPLAYVVAGTTDIGSSSCLGLLWCSHALRQLQRLARLRGSADLEHNFLIGGDGRLYEGRGWAVEGEHTLAADGLDARSLGVGFVGDHTTEPAVEQFRALEALLDRGVSGGHLARDYRLTDRCQLRRDKSCSAFTKELKKWRHWTDKL